MNDDPNIWHVEAHSESVRADDDIRGRHYPADEPPKKYLPVVGISQPELFFFCLVYEVGKPRQIGDAKVATLPFEQPYPGEPAQLP